MYQEVGGQHDSATIYHVILCALHTYAFLDYHEPIIKNQWWVNILVDLATQKASVRM